MDEQTTPNRPRHIEHLAQVLDDNSLAIETLREAVDRNREQVTRLAASVDHLDEQVQQNRAEFMRHDVDEVKDRRKREQLDEAFTRAVDSLAIAVTSVQDTNRGLQLSIDALGDRLDRMLADNKPVTDVATWLRLTKSGAAWIVATAATLAALAAIFGWSA